MQGARRGGEGVLANEDPPPQPRENVTCPYPPWAPARAAGGYNHLHFHPHFTSCCAIPGVWHSEGMTRTRTDHFTLCWVCHSVGLAYMAPKISSHLSLSSPSPPSSYSPYQARAQPGKVGYALANVAIQTVLPWSSLMRAHGFRRNMPARRRSCVSRSGNQVG